MLTIINENIPVIEPATMSIAIIPEILSGIRNLSEKKCARGDDNFTRRTAIRKGTIRGSI